MGIPTSIHSINSIFRTTFDSSGMPVLAFRPRTASFGWTQQSQLEGLAHPAEKHMMRSEGQPEGGPPINHLSCMGTHIGCSTIFRCAFSSSKPKGCGHDDRLSRASSSSCLTGSRQCPVSSISVFLVVTVVFYIHGPDVCSRLYSHTGIESRE